MIYATQTALTTKMLTAEERKMKGKIRERFESQRFLCTPLPCQSPYTLNFVYNQIGHLMQGDSLGTLCKCSLQQYLDL